MGTQTRFDLPLEPDDPDLSGRVARCSCGREEPSSRDLAFFEYRGPGSRSADEICACGYAQVAHDQEDDGRRINVVARGRCSGFRPRGDVGTDTFFCGCRGWN